MFFLMYNEHLIQAIVDDIILINAIIEGNEVGDRFLVESYMCIVTGYLYLVSD